MRPLWFGLHVGALVIACALLPVPVTTRLLAFGVAALSLGVIRDLVLGNVSVLLLPFLALAWRVPRPPRRLDRDRVRDLDAPDPRAAPRVAAPAPPLERRRMDGRDRASSSSRSRCRSSGPAGYIDYLTVLRNLSGITGVERNVDLGSTVARARRQARQSRRSRCWRAMRSRSARCS